MTAVERLSDNLALDSTNDGVKPIKLRRIWYAAAIMLILVFGAAFIANQTRPEKPEYVLLPTPPSVHDLVGRMDSILAKNILLEPKAAIWSANFCRRSIRPWVPVLVINTQPGSRRFRDLIRTHLKSTVLSAMDVVFTSGLSYGNGTAVEDLRAEVDEYEDLIVGEFMDKPHSTYNEGPSFAMVFISQCVAKDYTPNRVYINVSEFTTVNYRNLADWITAAQAVPDWENLVGAEGFEDLRHHNTTEQGSEKMVRSIISRWQDVNVDESGGAKKILAIPHPTFITTMKVIGELVHTIKDFRGYCASQKSKECLRSSMWRLIGDLTYQGKFRALTSDQIGIDKSVICEFSECDCSTWLTLAEDGEQETQSLELIAELNQLCPAAFEPIENSAKSRYTGLAGSSLQGPPLADFESATDDFCTSLKGGIVVGVLTKSNDFEVRKEIRDWFESHHTDLRPVFPVGRDAGREGAKNYDLLIKELQEYNDMIIGDYYDRYETLSTKTIMLMKWFTGCLEKNEDLHWMIKCDADIMTHPKANTELLDTLWQKGISEQDLFQDRQRSSDIIFKPEEYPFWLGGVFRSYTMGLITQAAHRNYEDLNLEAFPAYCSGPYYIVGHKIAQIILKNRLHDDLKNLYFRNEDAMIGIIIQHWNDHQTEYKKELENSSTTAAAELQALRDINPDMPIYPIKAPGIFPLDIYAEPGVCAGFKLTTNRGSRLQQCQCSRILAVPKLFTAEMEKLIERCSQSDFVSDGLSPISLSVPPEWPAKLPKLVNQRFPMPKKFDKKGFNKLLSEL